MTFAHKVFFPVWILFCFAIQESLAEDSSSTYTLHRDRLQHAGLVRLSDIFTLIDEWDMYSVEGYTFQGVANSYDIYHQQNWIILVDGHRMDLKLFDISNINLLPVSTNQIDSIEVFVTPYLIEDAFSDRGILHIHTRQIEEGFTVQGKFTVGNQTGDPGPYRYTEFWSENIDRIASDESYGLSYRADMGYIGASYYSQIFYPTDPLIADRNREIFPYRNPFIKTYSYNIRAGLSKIFSRPKLDIVSSRIDDFYFFKPLGREIPVENHFLSIGLIGQTEFSNTITTGYKLRYTRNTLGKRENAYDIYFDWSKENIYGSIHGLYKLSKLSFRFGLAAEQTKINTDYILTQNQINDGIIFTSIILDQKAGSRLNVDSEIRFNKHETGIKLAATNWWKMAANQGLFSNITYSQTMTNLENSIWYWSERGYDFIRDKGGNYTIEGVLHPARQWSVDLYWAREEDKIPSIRIGMNVRGFISKNWEEQPFEYEYISKTVSGPVTIRTGEQGTIGNIYLKLDSHQSTQFEHQIYYRYANVIGSNGLFSRIRDEIPASIFVYRVIYTPVNNFSIWAMCKYISSTSWNDFQNINLQSNGLYSSRLSDVILIDIAINKWLWKRQIKLDLILRNLLNKENLSYPIGASPNLRIYAQAEMYFNFW